MGRFSGITRQISRNLKKGAEDAAAEKLAEETAREEAFKPKVDAETAKTRVSDAGATARASADPLLAQAQGISREQFGLGEQDLAQRAASRRSLFQEQQGQLQARQGTTERGMQEAMQRRLGAQGLRGTGTAERLAQVSERQFGQAAAQQAAGLRLGQGQQELAAREAESQAIRQVEQFKQQAVLSANELATRLEATGMSNEQSRIFAENQLGVQQAFQENVVMKMQNEQFKERLGVAMDQFNQNMKQRIREFDLDEEISRFNMNMAESESGKGSMFDSLGDLGTQFWSNTFGRSSGSSDFSLPGFRSSSPGTGVGGYGPSGNPIDQFGVGSTSTGRRKRIIPGGPI